MVVLQICNLISPNPGNIIPSLEHLERKLLKKGHKTIYAFPEQASQTTWCKRIQERTSVYFLPYNQPHKKIKTYTMLRKIYKKNKVDIVHCHYDIYDFPVIIAAAYKNIKVFVHLHNALPENFWENKSILKRIRYFIGRYFFSKANLISVSDYYRKVACNKKFDGKKSTVIPNGLVTSRITKSYINVKKYDFLTFVSDFYGKGGDIIIDACVKLKNDGYNFKILFCGGGRREIGWKEFDAYILNSTLHTSLYEKVDVVLDVDLLYRNSKTFISASRKETFSMAICEAAYAGLNVISSDIPGVQWAKELPTVQFFKDGDSEQLYRLMKNVLEQGNIINETQIQKSRETIDQQYSAEMWTESLINEYLSK